VTEVYSKLLAVALVFCGAGASLVYSGLLSQSGDIFFLEFDEVRRVVEGSDSVLNNQLGQLVARRRSQLEQATEPVPQSTAPHLQKSSRKSSRKSSDKCYKVGASLGKCRSGKGAAVASGAIDRETILVVTILAGHLLARAGG